MCLYILIHCHFSFCYFGNAFTKFMMTSKLPNLMLCTQSFIYLTVNTIAPVYHSSLLKISPPMNPRHILLSLLPMYLNILCFFYWLHFPHSLTNFRILWDLFPWLSYISLGQFHKVSSTKTWLVTLGFYLLFVLSPELPNPVTFWTSPVQWTIGN